MSILKVARMGHPVLRTKTVPIDRSELRSVTVQKLIDDMIQTMVEYHGVGLAAPQVHESLRLFVASLDADDGDSPDDDQEPEPIAIINPEISAVGGEVVEDWEGCLSIPDIRGKVPRAHEIRVRALNRKGERIELHAHGFSARVIQHETDHLDGVLFFDRMRAFETLTFLDEYSRYWTKDKEFSTCTCTGCRGTPPARRCDGAVFNGLAEAGGQGMGCDRDADAIAAKYEVSRAWVHRLIQRRRETGSLAPRKQTKFRSRVLAGQEEHLAALITARPDAPWPNCARRYRRRPRSARCGWKSIGWA